MDYSTYVLFIAIVAIGFINYEQTAHRSFWRIIETQVLFTCFLIIAWLCWQVAWFD